MAGAATRRGKPLPWEHQTSLPAICSQGEPPDPASQAGRDSGKNVSGMSLEFFHPRNSRDQPRNAACPAKPSNSRPHLNDHLLHVIGTTGIVEGFTTGRAQRKRAYRCWLTTGRCTATQAACPAALWRTRRLRLPPGPTPPSGCRPPCRTALLPVPRACKSAATQRHSGCRR